MSKSLVLLPYKWNIHIIFHHVCMYLHVFCKTHTVADRLQISRSKSYIYCYNSYVFIYKAFNYYYDPKLKRSSTKETQLLVNEIYKQLINHYEEMKSNWNRYAWHCTCTGCRYIIEVLKDPTHSCNYLNSEIQNWYSRSAEIGWVICV